MLSLRYFQDHPRRALAFAVAATGLIAFLDFSLPANISVGVLYVFPMMLVGLAVAPWELVLIAACLTILSEVVDPSDYTWDVEFPGDAANFTVFVGAGLFTRALGKSCARTDQEVQRRKEAEQQLQFLIENSPAAVLFADASGKLILANPAAHRLVALEPPAMVGEQVSRFLPALGSVKFGAAPNRDFRTHMQCRGQKSNGEYFLADAFFSTYPTTAGPRLAALVVDASEHFRDREEASLDQLLTGSRILMSAVFHEIRNVGAAIQVVYGNLVRSGALVSSQDFQALGSLVDTLSDITSVRLKESAAGSYSAVTDIGEVLADLRIVLEPICREAEIDLRWSVPADLPPALADRHRLMQVLLNLTRNSQRALEGVKEKSIGIVAKAVGSRVVIRVLDSGPGIPDPSSLFQPLQEGAQETGLGLYLSRAFVRSFGGELRHEPDPAGCAFVIELPIS